MDNKKKKEYGMEIFENKTIEYPEKDKKIILEILNGKNYNAEWEAVVKIENIIYTSENIKLKVQFMSNKISSTDTIYINKILSDEESLYVKENFLPNAIVYLYGDIENEKLYALSGMTLGDDYEVEKYINWINN